MGEWSKSIGEEGERINKFLFEEILGVGSLVENISIDCVNGQKHQKANSKSERTTHGLDGFYYVESPVEDELLDAVIISSKYKGKYPKYPKSTFKSFIKDLAYDLECFKYSKLNSDINQKFATVTKTKYTGVLVWLSNLDDIQYDLIAKIDNSIIDNELDFEKIVVVDNSRITFLYESIYKSKLKYREVEFVYHDSSLNPGNLNLKAYGKRFPINYIYSDVLTMRVQEDNRTIFLIYINGDFNEVSFAQMLSFAKTYEALCRFKWVA
jgi:hypothetical protein